MPACFPNRRPPPAFWIAGVGVLVAHAINAAAAAFYELLWFIGFAHSPLGRRHGDADRGGAIPD